MLACTAMLVGCTDDVVDDVQENKQQNELVRGDAYVNFVISTSTDSSRGAIEGSTSGDEHTGADDNTHHVNGVRNENDINKVLVVVTKVEDVADVNANVKDWAKSENGMAKLYSTTQIENVDGITNGYVGFLAGSQINTTNGVTTLATPIRLDYTGSYAIAVVVNPVSELETEIKGLELNHKKAYEAILAYNGKAYEEVKDESGNVVKNDDGSTKFSFQMSNKDEIIVIAKPENNIPSNPVKANFKVERTVSKATWRWVNKQADLPGELCFKENVYTVNVNTTTQTPVKESFWYKEEKKDKENKPYDAYYYSEEFHKAVNTSNANYWILFKKEVEIDGKKKTLSSADYLDNKGQIITSYVEAIFTSAKEENQYIGVVDDTNKNKEDDEDDTQNESNTYVEVKDDLLTQTYATAVAAVTEELVRSLSFVYENNPTSSSKKYYVHLTHYALTNLTEKVYAVRHTFDGAHERQFGMLESNEYLTTPYFNEINNGTFANFIQGLSKINEEAASFAQGITGDIFKPLPTSGSDGTANSGHYTAEGASNDVGGFMQYFNENSCKADVAKAANVTGIVFAGQIYDENGVAVPILYQYNQKFYRTLQALLNENTIAGLTTNSTIDDAKAKGIDVYETGRCFYYSAQIKHLEDGDNNKNGVMEYAIMRNNIYSLAVKNISDIGDATLNLNPNTPISDIRSYVQIECTIMPWIVRFNDIEF